MLQPAAGGDSTGTGPAPTAAMESDSASAAPAPAQPLQYEPHLDGLRPGYEDYGVDRASGSRREAMRQKATSVASSLATHGSKSKLAAVGFLNKLSSAIPRRYVHCMMRCRGCAEGIEVQLALRAA